MKRATDTSDYVGHRCKGCGERVPVSPAAAVKGGGYWSRDTATGKIAAWHLNCMRAP